MLIVTYICNQIVFTHISICLRFSYTSAAENASLSNRSVPHNTISCLFCFCKNILKQCSSLLIISVLMLIHEPSFTMIMNMTLVNTDAKSSKYLLSENRRRKTSSKLHSCTLQYAFVWVEFSTTNRIITHFRICNDKP